MSPKRVRVSTSSLIDPKDPPEEAFFKLVEQGIYRVEEGHIYSRYGDQPLGGRGGTARGPLYIVAGRPPIKIPAPRLAWMIHHRERIPEGYSVVQIAGREDYSRENLALVPTGQERRFVKARGEV